MSLKQFEPCLVKLAGVKVPVPALKLDRVCVHKSISDYSGKHYTVSLVESGMGVISTSARHLPGGNNLNHAKALAREIEANVPDLTDLDTLSEIVARWRQQS